MWPQAIGFGDGLGAVEHTAESGLRRAAGPAFDRPVFVCFGPVRRLQGPVYLALHHAADHPGIAGALFLGQGHAVLGEGFLQVP